MSTIGNNISRIRRDLGLTQEDLAKLMGYKSKSTINKIELGINDIPQSKIVQFAEVLGTTPAELMGWKEEEKNNSPTEAELSEGEQMWLELYHRVSDDTRDILIKMMNSFDRLPDDRKEFALQVIRAALGDH
ncbi:MAG: helix-turn-helix transcriptional regulator [Clostridia bacterium]|nr:helix-turn-helix transcriptional regulator [Clostridia bacterium]